MPASPDKVLQPLGGARVIRRAGLPPNNKAPEAHGAADSRVTMRGRAAEPGTRRLALAKRKRRPMLRYGFGVHLLGSQDTLGMPDSLRRSAFGLGLHAPGHRGRKA